MQQSFQRTYDFLIEQVKRGANYTLQDSHHHPYFEIGYYMSGTRSMTINHSLYNLEKGCLVFIAKGELHKGFPVEDHPTDVELINLYFTEEYLEPFYQILGKDEISALFSNHLIVVPTGRCAYIEELFQKMLVEYGGIDELSKELLKSYFCELISFMIRYQKRNVGKIPFSGNHTELIEEAVEYIYYNYDKNLTLLDVATKYNMSKSHFSKKFKAVTGFGYKEYLTSVRLKEACNLLLTTDKTITEIAFQCGFNDSNYFGDAFRKAKGVSPHKYRKYNELF